MERFEAVCRDAGVKMTHQRMEVFREVAKTGDHPDAEKVHRGVAKRLPRISLDTVYRTLWLLMDFGLIATLGTSRDRTRFDANLQQHHHFICQRCGLTRDFYSESLDSLDIPESLGDIGEIEVTHVEARGICRKCKAEQESKS